jgi:hypothetical protein
MPYRCPLGMFNLLAGSDSSCVITLNSSTITTPSTASSTPDSTKAVAIAIPILVVAIIIAMVGLVVSRRRKKQVAPSGKEYAPEVQYGMGNNGSLPLSSAMDYYSPTPTPFAVPSTMLSLSQISSLSSPKPRPHYDAPPRRSGGLAPPPAPYSSPPASIASSVSPPTYRTFISPDGSRLTHTLLVVPMPREDAQDYDDEIRRYSATHRDVNPRELEERLRRARYLPTDNPNEISVDIWLYDTSS